MSHPTNRSQSRVSDPLAIDRDSSAAKAFTQLLAERGYPSINEFLVDVLREDRATKREAKLRGIGERMFPDDPNASGDAR